MTDFAAIQARRERAEIRKRTILDLVDWLTRTTPPGHMEARILALAVAIECPSAPTRKELAKRFKISKQRASALVDFCASKCLQTLVEPQPAIDLIWRRPGDVANSNQKL